MKTFLFVGETRIQSGVMIEWGFCVPPTAAIKGKRGVKCTEGVHDVLELSTLEQPCMTAKGPFFGLRPEYSGVPHVE